MTNLLSNPDFALPADSPNPAATYLTRETDQNGKESGTGRSETAALYWSHLAHIDHTVLSTDLLPSTDGPGSMIHVCTTKERSGILQVFPPGHDTTFQGPTHAIATARVYVLRGQVGLGLGDGGATALRVISTTTGSWETLTYEARAATLDEIIILAADPDGACFYVDHASVEAVP